MAKQSGMLFGIHEKPPILSSIFYGFQHMMSCLIGASVVPFIFADVIGLNPMETAALLSMTFLGIGIGTFLQVRFGSRLPIVTGSSYSFIVPSIAVMATSGITGSGALAYLSGALILGAVLPVIIGYFKIVGLLRKVFTPLVTATVITLIALSLVDFAAGASGENWGISLVVFAIICILSQILPRKYGKSWLIVGSFSVILAMFIGYLICGIGMSTGHIAEGSASAINFDLMLTAPWVFVPTPLHWGVPKFTMVGFLIIVAGYLAMMAESVGDIYVVSTLCDQGAPSKKQLNEGVGIQGISNLIVGLLGGVAVTSYTDNIGVIGLTRVASRFVVYIAAIMFVIIAFMGKFVAALAIMPDPVKGGAYIGILGLIAGFGASNIVRADMSSTRNCFIFGTAIVMGLGIPYWVGQNPLEFQPAWLSQWLDAVLSTHMFIGGIWAYILEILLPATAEERGSMV
jgi:nucleobase transporter 1/2